MAGDVPEQPEPVPGGRGGGGGGGRGAGPHWPGPVLLHSPPAPDGSLQGLLGSPRRLPLVAPGSPRGLQRQ
eukprot:8761595-Pyramimonas_sp.AAC.1